MPDTASVILFGIQSAIRLGQQARQAYVDSTRNRALVLPLPNFNPEPNSGSALIHYGDQPQGEIPVPIREAVAKSRANPQNPGLTEEESRMVLDYYNEYLLMRRKTWESIVPSPEGSFLTRESVAAAVKIRRWEREAKWQEVGQWDPEGPPGPSPLQRVAGTIVEIGIDYFAHVPGVFNDETRQGKAVRAVLTSLDKVEFADKPLGDLPTRLFIATLEGVAENVELLTSDEETQRLIAVTSSSLASDVSKRIQRLRAESEGRSDADRENGIIHWAELVFRSILSSGGSLIASDPRTYLGIDNTGDAALVTKVGEGVIDFVLKLPEGELHRTFGKEGLNVVITAALQAVGEHPEIIIRTDGNGKIVGASADGLKKLLSDIATDLGNMPRLIYRPALMPDIARLILEKTGKNIPILWPEFSADPKKNLLVVAAQKTLEILTQEPTDGVRWTPQFDDSDLLLVTEAVLDAFVESPGWLLDSAGKVNGNYRIALEATIDVLRKRGDARLSTATGVDILRAVLRAVALRQEFLENLAGGEKLVGAAVDGILAPLFPDQVELDPKAAVVLLRREILSTLVDESLQALSRVDLSSQALQQQHVDELGKLLSKHVDQIVDGKGWSLEVFLEGLEKTLPPALVVNP